MELVSPEDIQPKVEAIYQNIEGLPKACPNHFGNWFFTGNLLTPGGKRVLNKAFIIYMEKKGERAN